MIHGTTLVTNALIERKGALTALLTTAGFRDAVEIGREHRYELYDLNLDLPKPLVPRHLRFDVPERMAADGSVLTALDEDFVRRLVGELRDKGIKAIGVCYLNSFRNPAHERRTAEIIAEVAPQIRVSLSSEVVAEIREFQRTSTTLANVYVQERVADYLDAIASAFGQDRFCRQFLRHALERRHRDARNFGAFSCAPARIGTGGGRFGCGTSGFALRPSRFAFVRHGRHDRKALRHRRRPAAEDS